MLDTSTMYKCRLFYYRADAERPLRTESDDPRLKIVPYYKVRPDGTIINYLGKPVKTSVNSRGYVVTTIGNLGAVKTFPVHRLVLYTYSNDEVRKYIDEHPEIQVNHIDGNKQNNSITNLEWCTSQENIEHAIKLGLNVNNDYSSFKEAIFNDFRKGMSVMHAYYKYHDITGGISVSTLRNYQKKALFEE